MFFQQSHAARNAADEAEENERGGYYLDPAPWMMSSKKRFSTASALSSRSRRGAYDENYIIPSRSVSVESTQSSRQPSIASRGPGLGIYSRQSSAARSVSGQGRTSLAATKLSGNPVWRHAKRILSSSLGLFLFIQTYLCIGAFCFMWLETAKEEEQMNKMEFLRGKVAQRLVSCSDNVSCHEEALKRWETALLMFPQIYLEIGSARVWSWTYSYYCSFTIISTIGYGNVTPLSVPGRLFAVVYAVVGIPLMLLFITDIGNKFARWVKIAIIKFRKWKYKMCKRCKGAKKQNDDAEAKGDGEENRKDEGRGEGEVGGDEEVREAEGDSPMRDGGWNIPEVHINIAMSTMDEEACEMETKDLVGAGDVEAHAHDYGKDQTDDWDSSLHVHKDNSDYGGSSTGVAGCITDTFENAHEIVVPSFTKEDINRGKLVPYAVQESMNDIQLVVGGVTVDSSHDDGEKLDSASRLCAGNSDSLERVSGDVFVSIEPETAESRSPENANVSTREQEEMTVKDDQTKRQAPLRTDSLQNSEICKNEPSDILHTSSLRHQTAVDDRTCDKCGQTMKNVRNVRTGDEGSMESESLKSAEGIESNTEHVSGRTTRDSSKPEQYSPDSESMDINVFTPPLNKSLLGNEHSATSLLSYYREHSSTGLEPAKQHDKLSMKKSRSLESINELREDRPKPDPSLHRPAFKGTHPRRTSLPGGVNFSFQTKPAKQNGHLPNRHTERCERTDGDGEGDFSYRTAADSGVASSTSNSTECSPKRRLNSIHLNVVDSSDDDDDVNKDGGDDVISENDVMDSEEEKSFDKFQQLRFGKARPSPMGGREFMRVSEADIAMLSIPIWLALLLLLIYLLIGAGCFAVMQGWTFLDGFYYCFITLSTIGFGDLVFLPQNIHVGLIFSFLYAFVGLCFTSMCMSLSSMELTVLSRRISAKFGVYRGRIRSIRVKRWVSRRRRTIRAPSPDR